MQTNKYTPLLPHFLLATALIAIYRISGELAFFTHAWRVASPFVYGFFLAYILNIPCSSIKKRLAKSKNSFACKRQKLLSIILVFLSIIAIIAASLSLIIPAITKSITHFADSIPGYRESIAGHINNINNLFGWNINEEQLFDHIGNMFGDLSIETLLQPIKIISAATIGGVITLVSSIYLLFEKDRLMALIRRLFTIFASERTGLLVKEFFLRLNKYFRQYIRTQTIDGIIVSTLTTTLLFILRSPYALVLGVLMFLLNYIPYVGSIVAILIAVVIVAFTQGLAKGVIAAGALLFIQLLDGNFIQPRLMSDSFAISPYLVIVSITFGGAIAGVFGMLFAIPIAAVLKDIFDSTVEYYEGKKL